MHRRGSLFWWLRGLGLGLGLASSQLRGASDQPGAPNVAATAEKPVPALDWPAGLSMPVRLIGIDSSDAAAAKAALSAAEKAVAASWLSAPKPLTQLILPQHPVTMNAQRRTDRILFGSPISAASAGPIALEPAWCTLMDRHVLFVTVADARSNQLLGSAHTSVPRAQWPASLRTPFLSTSFSTLARTALAQAAQKAGAPESDALHLGLDLAANVSRADEGSSLCLTLLLEQRLAPDFTVARALGGDILATARDQLGQVAQLRRPTRRLVLQWNNPPASPGNAPKRTLPVTLELTASRAESVLGQHVPQPLHKSRWTFSPASGGQIGFDFEAGLRKLLDEEKNTLKLSDAPQAAKIDRAWVFLDRGRAWGLKMNDRMLTQGPDGASIKGHVVRFFGPELKIMSPRGFPIEEGAILYIRKNQRLAKVGQIFAFDPKAFPAPWPPVKAP